MHHPEPEEVDRQLAPRLAEVARAYAEDPANAQAALRLAVALNAAQEFPQARHVVMEVLETGAPAALVGDLWYERLHAIAREDPRELPAHARQAQKLLRENPGAAWAHRNVALVHFYTERDAASRKALGKALALAPRDARSHELQVLLAQSDADPDVLRDCIAEGLKAAPGSARLHKAKGDLHLEVGETEEARDAYRKAVELEPVDVESWHALGDLRLTHDRDYEGAVRLFGHALAINPRYWDVYFTLADYYVEEKRYDLAKAEVHRLLLLDPPASIKAEVENHLGYMDYLLGHHEDAIRRYRRAIAMDPEFDSPWHNLGLVHVHQKDFDGAIECFRKAIALNEDRSWSYTQLGMAYFEQKSYRKARQLFEEALERNPEEYGAHLGLAELHRREKRHDLQLEACLRALQVEPNDGNVRNYLGIAYECMRKPEEAVKQYQEALRLDSHNRWAANNLGYLYEKLLQSTKDPAYREKALRAWRVRLLICRDTQTSTAGARRHILKLGVAPATFERWLREGKLEIEIEKAV